MPAAFSIDKSRRLVTSTYAGLVTLDEIMNNFQDIRIHPDFQNTFDHLADCTDEKLTTNISSTEIGALPFNTPFATSSILAIAATSPAIFGLARMYQQRSMDEAKVAVFKTMNEARAWLEEERRKRTS